jgi:hypothetical protein
VGLPRTGGNVIGSTSGEGEKLEEVGGEAEEIETETR